MNHASPSSRALDLEATATTSPAPAGDAARPSLSVIGTGYLGATHAAAMAELGFDVVGIDADAEKVRALALGKVPFFEPGLEELLLRHVESGRLRFTTDLREAAAADVHFVCVGTPQRRGSNAADTSYVEQAVADLVPLLTRDALVVGKSTVPVGTAQRLRATVARLAPAGVDVELVWNPEFLREGRAVEDTLHPDRVVVGGCSERADAVLRQVYAQPVAEGAPYLGCDLATAELVKVSANAFLATKISFVNAIAQLCDAAGADVAVLADCLGHDPRIGRQFLDAGLGFGGGCLPKDIRALMHRSGELGAHRVASLMQQVDEINMSQRERVVDLATELCGGTVLNRRVGVLGAAFKPLTDDVRDSPALNVAAALHLRGAQVVVYDPQAGDTARRTFPTLPVVASVEEAVEGTDVVLLLTEWEEFRTMDPAVLAPTAARPAVVDGRACLDADAWRAAGWTYRGLGRAAA